MANIHVVVEGPIADGTKVKFRTPCDSTTIEGLEVKYPAKDGVGSLIKKFVFKDAHGTELSGVGNLFVSGVMIEVLLDVTHGVAYIQNADTNSYVESVKGEVQRLEESQRQFLGVAGKVVEECERATAETVSAIAATNEATNTLVLTHEDFVSGGYVEKLKELNAGHKFGFWVGTLEEYNVLDPKPVNTMCIITDEDDIVKVIESLGSEIEVLNGKMSGLDSSIATINESLESIETAQTNISHDLESAYMRINNLENPTPAPNTLLWSGELTVNESTPRADVVVPHISDYKVLEIDGYMYHRKDERTAVDIASGDDLINFECVYLSRESYKSGDGYIPTLVLNVITIGVNMETDTIVIHHNTDLNWYSYNRIITSYYPDKLPATASTFTDGLTIKEIIGIC